MAQSSHELPHIASAQGMLPSWKWHAKIRADCLETKQCMEDLSTSCFWYPFTLLFLVSFEHKCQGGREANRADLTSPPSPPVSALPLPLPLPLPCYPLGAGPHHLRYTFSIDTSNVPKELTPVPPEDSPADPAVVRHGPRNRLARGGSAGRAHCSEAHLELFSMQGLRAEGEIVPATSAQLCRCLRSRSSGRTGAKISAGTNPDHQSRSRLWSTDLAAAAGPCAKGLLPNASEPPSLTVA